ncbi:MAG: PHP domain-containing protein [candidate division Zixibacteria bacterium]|nr:PHP domain-containing protein [candidate division Zixibacteria bacterium]
MANKIDGRYHYSGVVHIHTTESDGTKPIEEVIQIGCRSGLDFMMFSDHMSLKHYEAGHEGIYGDTLVVIGYEHNDLDDNNHFLIFNSPSVYPYKSTAAEYVKAVCRDGAFGIVAHPIEHRSREGKYPPYPWLEWGVDEFNGLEIWNQMSEWMEKLTPWNKLAMAFSPRKSMVGPTAEVLQIWDQLSLKRQYVGVTGVDAHAFPVKVGPLTVVIFPYKVHFKALRTHIVLDEPLSSDFDTARRQLFKALAACRVFCSNLRWGDANEFVFRAIQGSKTAVSGDTLSEHEGVRLEINLPSRATIKLIGNGQELVRTTTESLEYSVGQPGLYRVEVWKGRRGWIFSNHIRIGQFGDDV